MLLNRDFWSVVPGLDARSLPDIPGFDVASLAVPAIRRPPPATTQDAQEPPSLAEAIARLDSLGLPLPLPPTPPAAPAPRPLSVPSFRPDQGLPDVLPDDTQWFARALTDLASIPKPPPVAPVPAGSLAGPAENGLPSWLTTPATNPRSRSQVPPDLQPELPARPSTISELLAEHPYLTLAQNKEYDREQTSSIDPPVGLPQTPWLSPAAPASAPNYSPCPAAQRGEQQTPLQSLQTDGAPDRLPSPATRYGITFEKPGEPGTPPTPPISAPSEPISADLPQQIMDSLSDGWRVTSDQAKQITKWLLKFGDRVYRDSILKAADDLPRLARRFTEDPMGTFNSVFNSFPQTRVEGELLANFAVVVTILTNAARGRQFEKAAIEALNAARQSKDIKKNTAKIHVDGLGRSVPGILLDGVTEVKSGIEIDNSIQTMIQGEYTRIKKIKYNLIVSPETRRISATVREKVERTGGTIQVFDPETGTFRPFK